MWKSVMSNSLWPYGLYSPWNSLGQNTALLQGIFPTQESNRGFPHCGRILYQLSYKGSPRILEWVAYPLSRSFWPRNPTRVSCIAGRFFTNWAIRETWDCCRNEFGRLAPEPLHLYVTYLQWGWTASRAQQCLGFGLIMSGIKREEYASQFACFSKMVVSITTAATC